MKTETREVYKCDHCNRMYQRKHHCKYHEKICHKNQDNLRKCNGCDHFGKRNIDVTVGYHYTGGEINRTVNLFFCKAKNIFLYPPQTEVKGNMFELGDDLNEPMPKECDLFKECDYIF